MKIIKNLLKWKLLFIYFYGKEKNNLYKIIQNHYDKIIDILYKVLNLITDISNDNYLNIYSIL